MLANSWHTCQRPGVPGDWVQRHFLIKSQFYCFQISNPCFHNPQAIGLIVNHLPRSLNFSSLVCVNMCNFEGCRGGILVLPCVSWGKEYSFILKNTFWHPPHGDWDRPAVSSGTGTAHPESLVDHHSLFLHLWSGKEQGFLRAKQSSREMKVAAWRCRGRDCEAQSNWRHMECFHWGQKGDLLKDKIKLKKGERRGAMRPGKWGIIGGWGYLWRKKRQDKR